MNVELKRFSGILGPFCLLAALGTTPAIADQISFSEPLLVDDSGNPDFSITETLTFPKFDPALGTLTEVQIFLDMQTDNDVEFENIDEIDVTFDYEVIASQQIFLALFGFDLDNKSDTVTDFGVNLQPGDLTNDLAQAIEFSLHSFQTSGALNAFSGAGATYDIDVTGSGSASVTNSDGAIAINGLVQQTFGEVEVTYIYDPTPVFDPGHTPVFNTIDILKPIADAIVVDGDPNDWDGIPFFEDPNGDAGGNPALDIVRAAFAPLEDAWYVLIESAGPPSQNFIQYRLRIDYREQNVRDLELGLRPDFLDFYCWWNADTSFNGCTIFDDFNGLDPNDSEIAISGNFFEAKIPISLLQNILPAEFSSALNGAAARPFMRVTPTSEDPNTFALMDVGPAIGSYRLKATPYELDAALPVPDANSTPDPAVVVGLPLDGIQFVGQGSGGLFSHAGVWGYDFFRTNNAGQFSDPDGSLTLGDFLSFGDTITAPAAGTFWSSLDGNFDETPDCSSFDPNTFGVNFQFYKLDADPSVGLLFSHIQNGTVTPLGPFTNPIPQGTLLGNVGNSGVCFGDPHLHFGAETLGGAPPFPSRPIELTSVEVGLNPVENDPWLRRPSQSWGIREGYYVQPAAKICGDLDQNRALEATDAGILASHLVDPNGTPLSQSQLDRCSVVGNAMDCDLLDWVVLTREAVDSTLAPGTSEICTAALP